LEARVLLPAVLEARVLLPADLENPLKILVRVTLYIWLTRVSRRTCAVAYFCTQFVIGFSCSRSIAPRGLAKSVLLNISHTDAGSKWGREGGQLQGYELSVPFGYFLDGSQSRPRRWNYILSLFRIEPLFFIP
jgi:hypothetical protein